MSSSSDDSIVEEGHSLSTESSLRGSTSDNNVRNEKFTQRESVHVFRLRVLVIAVIIFSAVAVSVVVYLLSKNGEEDEYQMQFDGTAEKVMIVFQDIVTEKLDALAGLSIAITAHGVDHFRSWPFVTLSSFQQRVTNVRKQSGALFVGVAHEVTDSQRDEWENYSVIDEDGWIRGSVEFQKEWDVVKLGLSLPDATNANPGFIMKEDLQTGIVRDDSDGPFLPVWETSPLLNRMVNFNLASVPEWSENIRTAMEDKMITFGRMITTEPGDASHENFLTRFFASMLSIEAGTKVNYQGDPFSYVFLPVYETHTGENSVATVFAAINWASYFENVLPNTITGITVVLSNGGCDTPYTYTLNGDQVVLRGAGDLHETKFSSMGKSLSFTDLKNVTLGRKAEGSAAYETASYETGDNGCPFEIHVYPSQDFYDQYNTSSPITITLVVGGIFVFSAILFILYDRLVERRQQLILKKAIHSTEILASLFPKNIREEMMREADEREKNNKNRNGNLLAPKSRLRSYLNDGDDGSDPLDHKPLADLFPHATVFFADISGFTAWSSSRDPASVFILLQTLYQAFDTLAKRRRVFKVETIGDSYVAVTGVPDAQPMHALIMSRFAADALLKSRQVLRDLTVKLGPDTAELSIRVGLHSGPVTAGVLRGERSRFQLFGDTVNTAARMESTGVPGRIQLSQATANILREHGKEHWVKQREDAVHAKGKGVLNTYWLCLGGERASTAGSSEPSESGNQTEMMDSVGTSLEADFSENLIKQERLIDWVVERLSDYMRKVVALRDRSDRKRGPPKDYVLDKTGSNLSEVVEVIALPKFDGQKTVGAHKAASVKIDSVVMGQLRKYVSIIASAYRDNPFHNFEHACHVVMSADKFLQRIQVPDIELNSHGKKDQKNAHDIAQQMHAYTHGINSDPMTLFAILFSALIHDVDHRAVGNVQLAKEDKELAALYENKSIAEQNSLDVSWSLLMTPDYRELRQCLFADEQSFKRFRQVVVNVVLATDIFDKELNDLRKARWNKAFHSDGDKHDLKPQGDDYNGLRATIVIEHIIQASDVAHTMQHWHVYRKFNERLFHELYQAYQAGRMGADPCTFWYKGELSFFDNYIIPLAKKLKECEVFGVSSDECLNYALRNRGEWEQRGEEIVEEMIENLKAAQPLPEPNLLEETKEGV